MAKDSFIFHLENAEDLEDLTLEEQGMILTALIHYTKTGEEPDFEDRAVRAAWRPIFRRLKSDMEYYEERCERNSQNGAKGGAPKGNQNARKTAQNNPKQPKTTENNPEQPKTSLSDSDSDIDTDYEKKKVPTEPKKKSGERFSPPTPEEVQEYCQEKSLRNVDPQQFVDFYASKGWKVGNQPMKDWRAATRNWNSRQKSPPASRNQFLQFEQHSYDMDELMKRAKRRTV